MLVTVFLAGLAVRIAHLLVIRGTPLTDILLIDSDTYDRLARAIRGGTYGGEPAYAMNLLYPWFIAAVYVLAKNSLIAVLALQTVLDAASGALAAWVGARLFGRAAGWIAGLGVAAYAPMVFYSGALLTPTLITFLGLVAVALLVAYGAGPRASLAVWAGLAIGFATLGRGNNLLMALAAPLAIAVAAGTRRRAVAHGALLVAAALAPPAAATLRNAVVEGAFVPIAANYAAFYVGHNPGATGLYAMPSFTSSATFEGEVTGTREALSRELGRPVTLAESSQILMRRGLDHLLAHPADELRTTGRKLRYFWNRVESPTNLNFHFARDFSWVLRVLPLHFGIVAPLGLFGLWLARRTWRDHLALILHLAVALVTALLFFVSAEYRVPAAPVLIVYAAYAVVSLWRAAAPAPRAAGRGRRAGRTAAPRPDRSALVHGVVALPLLFVACNLTDPLLRLQMLKRVDYLNFGTLYLGRQDYDGAERMLRRSVAIDPAFGPAYGVLSQVARARGNTADALRWAALARRHAMGGQFAEVGRADALADSVLAAAAEYRAGNYPVARAAFERLIARAGPDTDPRQVTSLLHNLALCEHRLGRLDEAESLLRRVLDRDSTFARAHANLGRLLADRGRIPEARAELERALALDPELGTARRALAQLDAASPPR